MGASQDLQVLIRSVQHALVSRPFHLSLSLKSSSLDSYLITMACRLTVPFWPTSVDCLKWSSDNYLAVAGGEHIAILLPKLLETGPDETIPWTTCMFRVNTFLHDEAPTVEPFSHVNFSIGEEQSQQHVQALDWSAPGLATYGRCALAVLNTSHVLSIWHNDGQPDVASSWKRAVVVNHVVRRYYESASALTDRDAVHTRRERLQIKQRIRSFAWSPTIYQHYDDDLGELTPYSSRGQQILAVSTEAGDVLLLSVQSPHSSYNTHKWALGVIGRFRVQHSVGPGDLALSTPDSQVSRSRDIVVHQMQWGRWKPSVDRTQQAALMYIVQGRLTWIDIQTSSTNDTLDLTLSDPKSMRGTLAPITGALRVVPMSDCVLACAANRVYCVTVSEEEPSVEDVTLHHLDGRWDEVSGVTFSRTADARIQTHIVSQTSTAVAPTTSLFLPLREDGEPSEVQWRQAMLQSKAAYGVQHSLEDHVNERTWGIATSPLGDYIATCFSLHPSDAIEYVISSEQECNVSITANGSKELDKILAAAGSLTCPQNVSAETVLFSAQQQHSESQTSSGQTEADFVNGILQSIAPPTYAVSNPDDMDGDSCATAMVRRLKEQVYWRATAVQSRTACLAGLVLKDPQAVNRVSRSTVERLIAEVLRLPIQRLQHDDRSTHILKTFALVKSKLQLDASVNAMSVDNDERCRICSRSLPFESIKWARCEAGHQFTRCALTFSAIQESGVMKRCGLCTTQYFDEDTLFGTTTSPATDSAAAAAISSLDRRPTRTNEPTSSLARMLFFACDACIYCGGKFVR